MTVFELESKLESKLEPSTTFKSKLEPSTTFESKLVSPTDEKADINYNVLQTKAIEITDSLLDRYYATIMNVMQSEQSSNIRDADSKQSAPSCTNVSTTTTSPISTPLSASAKAAIIHDRPDPQEMGDDDRPIIEDDNYLQQDAADDIRHGNTM
jgi:hypothetical protein